jgi:predicted molibdopterin-dependent oxidoreductase YjgC
MFKSEYDLRAAGEWDESRQKEVDTICPYCGVGCTLQLRIQDNEIVRVMAPLDNDITLGNLCIKGRFGWRFVQNRGPSPLPRVQGDAHGNGSGNGRVSGGDGADGGRGNGAGTG